LTEEEAKTVALYKFARENFQYSKDNTYVIIIILFKKKIRKKL
jgi:hypothetical protein